MAEQTSRRERLRAETEHEIRRVARRLLVERGPDAVGLRAIAREMGMTAPGLYRYFDSHQELVRRVMADLFGELADFVLAAVSAEPAADPARRLLVAAHAFRRWALSHRTEFGLLFAAPPPSLNQLPHDLCEQGAQRFGGVFLALFGQLWAVRPFPVPAPEEIDPDLRDQLDRVAQLTDVPPGAVLACVACWCRLYGLVALEVFGHLRFALADSEPLFVLQLAEMARVLGIEVTPEQAEVPAHLEALPAGQGPER